MMDDQRHGQLNSGADLFTDYATVADSLGVYTTKDYADIIDHLVARWGVADLQVGGRAWRGGAGAQARSLGTHAWGLRAACSGTTEPARGSSACGTVQ
jgi:hypothetical protein